MNTIKVKKDTIVDPTKWVVGWNKLQQTDEDQDVTNTVYYLFHGKSYPMAALAPVGGKWQPYFLLDDGSGVQAKMLTSIAIEDKKDAMTATEICFKQILKMFEKYVDLEEKNKAESPLLGGKKEEPAEFIEHDGIKYPIPHKKWEQ